MSGKYTSYVLPVFFLVMFSCEEPARSRGSSSCAKTPVVEVLDFPGYCAPLPGSDPDGDVDMKDPGREHSPRRILPDTAYRSVVRISPGPPGYARIRSRLVFAASDKRNLLGTVASCSRLRAAGPMKNSSGSMGIGYSIRLRDPRGVMCQGFLSATVLTVELHGTGPVREHRSAQ